MRIGQLVAAAVVAVAVLLGAAAMVWALTGESAPAPSAPITVQIGDPTRPGTPTTTPQRSVEVVPPPPPVTDDDPDGDDDDGGADGGDDDGDDDGDDG